MLSPFEKFMLFVASYVSAAEGRLGWNVLHEARTLKSKFEPSPQDDEGIHTTLKPLLKLAVPPVMDPEQRAWEFFKYQLQVRDGGNPPPPDWMK